MAAKDAGRDSRLAISNYAEYEMRKELAAIARAKCDGVIAAFAACAKEHGMMVVLNCRAHNREMNACLSQYSTEEAFNAYKAKRFAELEAGETRGYAKNTLSLASGK